MKSLPRSHQAVGPGLRKGTGGSQAWSAERAAAWGGKGDRAALQPEVLAFTLK